MAKQLTVKTLSTKKLDTLVDRIYTANCQNIEISIMDIPKVFKVGKQAYTEAVVAGAEIEPAMTKAIVDFVQKVRKN